MVLKLNLRNKLYVYILYAIMCFSAKIPFHTYKKYFDTEYKNDKYKNTTPVKLKIVFVAIDNDFERIMVKWYCSQIGTCGEIDENKYKDVVSTKIHTWIKWNGRSGFSIDDFL